MVMIQNGFDLRNVLTRDNSSSTFEDHDANFHISSNEEVSWIALCKVRYKGQFIA